MSGSKRIRSCMLEHGITSPFIIIFFQYRSTCIGWVVSAQMFFILQEYVNHSYFGCTTLKLLEVVIFCYWNISRSCFQRCIMVRLSRKVGKGGGKYYVSAELAKELV